MAELGPVSSKTSTSISNSVDGFDRGFSNSTKDRDVLFFGVGRLLLWMASLLNCLLETKLGGKDGSLIENGSWSWHWLGVSE